METENNNSNNESKKIMQLHQELLTSSFHFFPTKGTVNVSDKQGVYIIYNSNQETLHVGKTDRGKEGINQRLLNHLRNQSSFAKKYLKRKNIILRNGCEFKYIEVENGRTRALLEALTTGLLCPAHIGTGEKKILDYN